MTLSEISIRKPVFAWMLMIAFMLFGWICFRRLGVSQLPDVDLPTVSVSAVLEGAAPEVIETSVVEVIEDAVISIGDVKSLTSTSSAGRGSVTVEFDLKKDIDVAVQEVQSALARVLNKFPKGMDPPRVSKQNPEDHPIIWMSVRSDKMSDRALMTFVRDRVKDRFTTVPGVGEINLGGYLEPNLRIWVSSRDLDRYALSVGDVINTIRSEHSELPAGRIQTEKKEWNVRTMGEAYSVKEFEAMAIQRRGGAPNYTPLRLGDVAKIEEGLEDVRRRSRAMGKFSVGLGIKKQRGSNAVEVAHAVRERMEQVKKEMPEGAVLDINFDSTVFIEEAIGELNFTLVLSAILTAFVCWLFLGSWSATFNIILSIPTSILGSFIILYMLGFTLNIFTLLALSLAIGIIVDDAIMVLENIVRHYENGSNKVLASLAGAKEITFAAMAATAAIIAVFLPVAFMEGMIGKYFFQFGVTLSVGVALSLVEALTFTPMRCAQFLHTGRESRIGRLMDWGFDRLRKLYERTLEVTLRWRWITVIGSFLFFGATMYLAKVLKTEYAPAQDQSRLLVRMRAPIGSSLGYTDGKLKQLEAILMARGEVDKYFGSVGGFGGSDVDTAMLFVTMKPYAQRPVDPVKGKPLTQQEFAGVLRKQSATLQDTKVFIQDLSQSGFGGRRGYPVSFTLKGSDWEKLVGISEQLKAAMEKSGLMIDVDSDYRAGMPEYQIRPDREKARLRGVSVVDINETLQAMLGGVIVGKYSQGNRREDIRVQVVADERESPKDVSRFNVRNNRGELIPLASLVTIDLRPAPQTINHEDRVRAIGVFSNVAPGASQGEAVARVQALAKDIVPEGYELVLSGNSQEMGEAFRGLVAALGLGVLVAYMILASQFNSFIHPVTVLVALPFSLSGAFLALWIGGQTINIYSMIGVILLMGIVKKNSILLVDFTNQMRDEGKPLKEALLTACPARLRPILMTSMATIAAAVPGAVALGPGAESRIPMSVVVIGGAALSTLLTLFVVPSFYSLVAFKARRTLEEELTELKAPGSTHPTAEA